MSGTADYLARSARTLARAAADLALSSAVDRAADACADALAYGAPVLVCGNGGSAADAMHLAGELVGRFRRERRALNVIALGVNPATFTAVSNDYAFESVFAREVEAYGRPGGALIAISTSGNSRNVIAAAHAARARAMTVVALTGEGGGALAPLADILLAAPTADTPLVQQVHLCLYHALCDAVETRAASPAA